MKDYEIVYRSSLFKGTQVKTISAYTRDYARLRFILQMSEIAKWFKIVEINYACKS